VQAKKEVQGFGEITMCLPRMTGVVWKRRGILPVFYQTKSKMIFKYLKTLDKNGGGGGS